MREPRLSLGAFYDFALETTTMISVISHWLQRPALFDVGGYDTGCGYWGDGIIGGHLRVWVQYYLCYLAM